MRKSLNPKGVRAKNVLDIPAIMKHPQRPLPLPPIGHVPLTFGEGRDYDELTPDQFSFVHARLGSITEQLSADEIYRLGLSLINLLVQRAAPENFENAESGVNGDISPGAAMLYITGWAMQSLRAIEFSSHQGGNPFLAQWAEMVRRTVHALNDQALQRPHIFQQLMSLERCWPVLYSPNLHMGTNLAQSKTNVGQNYFLKLTGKGSKKKKSPNPGTPRNRLALMVITTLMKNKFQINRMPAKDCPEWVRDCAKLGDFNKTTVHEWLTVAWKCILDATGEHPEKDELCRKVAKSSAAAKVPADCHLKASIRSELKEAMFEWAKAQPGAT